MLLFYAGRRGTQAGRTGIRIRWAMLILTRQRCRTRQQHKEALDVGSGIMSWDRGWDNGLGCLWDAHGNTN